MSDPSSATAEATAALNLPTPPARPSEAAMKTALQAYIDQMNAGDAEGLVALFAPDATIEDPVGSPARAGAELGAWFRASAALKARLRAVTACRGSFAREAALVFEVEYNADGRRLRIRTLDVCQFNEDGLITNLRGYWGPADVDDIGPAVD